MQHPSEQMRSKLLLLALAALSCVLVPSGVGHAAVPPMIHYQAYLTDDGGAPLSGTVDLEFAIFDSSAAGMELWSEAHPATPVEEGVASVVLGTVTAIDSAIFTDASAWLETRVDGVAATPRRPFVSVPYALRAQVAETALSGGGDGAWVVDGANVYRPDGNVGVGTDSPTERFHAVSPLFARLRLERTGGSIVHVDASGSSGSVGTQSAHPFRLLTQNTVRMHIDTDGEVGIGSTTPDGKLDVRASGGQDVLNLYDGGSLQLSMVSGGRVGIGVNAGIPVDRLQVETATEGVAVSGRSTSASGSATGVKGVGTVYGVLGEGNIGMNGIGTPASGGIGVFGQSNSSSGGVGIVGQTGSTDGRGVWGNAFGSALYGVYGQVQSASGWAGFFTGGKSYLQGPVGINVQNPLGRFMVEAEAAEEGMRVRVGGVTKFKVDSNGGIAIGANFTPPTDGVAVQGSVGIGTANPSFTLHVDGTAGKPGGGSWAVASDLRLKKNIQPLQGALDSLCRVETITYEYIDPQSIHEASGERIGVVAQQVEEVFPDWVDEGTDGFKRVSFRGFEALTIAALRELRAERDAEVAALRDRLEAAEKRAIENERALAAILELLPALGSNAVATAASARMGTAIPVEGSDTSAGIGAPR